MRTTMTRVITSVVILPGAMMTAAEAAKAESFDATAEIACAQEVGEELRACEAAVSRADGIVTVKVTFPNGFTRVLLFDDGVFLRGNPTMSGVGTDTDWTLSDGMYLIRVDDQQYRIPEALVLGE